MVDRPALSKGEMDVARALWDVGPASVRSIHEAVCETRKMDFTTVQTYLRRLETKSYAASKLDGRIRIYSARAKARTVIRDTVDDLVQRLFGGDSMPLMRHLIEDGEIGPEEIEELRGMIDGLAKKKQAKEKS